jgi:hypothetical protein
MLYMDDKTFADQESLEGLSTDLVVSVKTSDGRSLCEGAGPLPAEPRTEGWVLMTSAIGSAYWHTDCVDLRFDTGSEYRLAISIANPDSSSPRAVMRPVLTGGGFETP